MSLVSSSDAQASADSGQASVTGSSLDGNVHSGQQGKRANELEFVVGLFFWSLNGLAGCTFIILLRRLLLEIKPWVSSYNFLLEDLLRINGTLDVRHLTVPEYGERFRTEQFYMSGSYGLLWIFSYFHMCVILYLGFSRRAIIVATASLLISTTLVHVLFVVQGHGVFFLTSPTISTLCFNLGVWLAYPEAKLFNTTLFRLCLMYALGCIWFSFWATPFIEDPDLWTALLVLFFFPLMREIMRYLAVRATWKLSFSKDPAGKGVLVNRTAACTFMLWSSITLAMLSRLQFANINNPVASALVIVLSGVQETVMRITVERRDHWINGQLSRRNTFVSMRVEPAGTRERRNTLLGTTSAFSRNSVAITQHAELPISLRKSENARARRNFYSFVVVMDMVSEYTAILACALSFLTFHRYPYFTPLTFYQARTADGMTDILSFEDVVVKVIMWSTFQVVAEIVVDTMCIVYEQRRGLDVVSAWHERYYGVERHYILACIMATATSLVMAAGTDIYTQCGGQSMCACANGSGLVKDGILDNLCTINSASLSASLP